MDLTKQEAVIGEKLLNHKKALNDQCRPDIISILVGNKADNPEKKIKKDRARRLADKLQFLKYIEVSSTEGTNIGKVMEIILSNVEKNQMWQPERR